MVLGSQTLRGAHHDGRPLKSVVPLKETLENNPELSTLLDKGQCLQRSLFSLKAVHQPGRAGPDARTDLEQRLGLQAPHSVSESSLEGDGPGGQTHVLELFVDV